MPEPNTAASPSASAVPQEQRAWYTKGSIPLPAKCLCGIPTYIHYSFFLVMVIMLLSALIGHSSDPAYWGLIALVYGPILLVTIIIHELSHAMVNRWLGELK